ncbi:hypothetical protein [Dictyobacter aurantiacus]|uniref:hypothetical protein n=1 Tax=Dictyobacter aurantiacus TaxID=1936993 RepID=UPI00135CE675|nr:hypothetical protein [Dictyobacter aurantiacus]
MNSSKVGGRLILVSLCFSAALRTVVAAAVPLLAFGAVVGNIFLPKTVGHSDSYLSPL